MITKKKLVVVVSAFLALAVGAGCAAPNDGEEPSASSEDPLTVRAPGGDLGDLGDLEPVDQTAERTVGGPVTCEGDQNNGGRICCDDIHCCINIGGTINCSLPPKKKKLEYFQQWP